MFINVFAQLNKGLLMSLMDFKNIESWSLGSGLMLRQMSENLYLCSS